MPGGWAGKNKGWGGGSRQFQDSPRGVMRKLAYKRGGGLSDFTILFYFKEMCSLLSAVLRANAHKNRARGGHS